MQLRGCTLVVNTFSSASIIAIDIEDWRLDANRYPKKQPHLLDEWKLDRPVVEYVRDRGRIEDSGAAQFPDRIFGIDPQGAAILRKRIGNRWKMLT
jgi:hypothetical protein